MYGENGLTEIRFTSWWWISMPKATGVIHTCGGIVDITPPYFRFLKGLKIADAISKVCVNRETRVMRMECDDEKEERFRYT